MTIKKYYNIHNILTIQINTQNKAKLLGLNFPLSYFETKEEIANPDIILNIGPFEPELNNSYIVDHKYYIRENYFYCSDTADGKASWRVEIAGFEKPPTVINFYGRIRGIYQLLAPDLLAQEIVLFPILELALGLEGYFLAHAGSIAQGKKGILFIGRSGSKKTTIVMNAVRKGYKTLGDERVILDLDSSHKGIRMLSFPIFPKIFEFTLMHSRDEYLTISKKLEMLSYLKKIRLQSADIWQNKAELMRIYFLLSKMSTENETFQGFIHRFIANNYSELYSTNIPSLKRNNFPNYISAYSFIFPDNNWNNLYFNVLLANIKRILSNKKILIITPERLMNKDFNIDIYGG